MESKKRTRNDEENEKTPKVKKIKNHANNETNNNETNNNETTNNNSVVQPSIFNYYDKSTLSGYSRDYDAIINIDNPHIFGRYLESLKTSVCDNITFYVTSKSDSNQTFEGLEIASFNTEMTVAIDGRFEGSVFIYNNTNENSKKFTISLKTLLSWINIVQCSDTLLFAIKNCNITCIIKENGNVTGNAHLDLPLLMENQETNGSESQIESVYDYMIEMNQGVLKSKIKILKDLSVCQVEFALYEHPSKPIYYFVIRGLSDLINGACFPYVGTLSSNGLSNNINVNNTPFASLEQKQSKYVKYIDGKLIKIKVKNVIEISDFSTTNNNNNSNTSSSSSSSEKNQSSSSNTKNKDKLIPSDDMKSNTLVQNWNHFNLIYAQKIALKYLNIFLKDFERIKVSILMSSENPFVLFLSNSNFSHMKYAIAPLADDDENDKTKNDE